LIPSLITGSCLFNVLISVIQVDDKTEPANKMGKEEAIVKASDVNPNPALAPAVVEA